MPAGPMHMPMPMTTHRPITINAPIMTTRGYISYDMAGAPAMDYYEDEDCVVYDGGYPESIVCRPEPCSGNMTMFSKTYYRGESIILTGDRTELGDFDDNVVSIQVKGNCCWQLFPLEDYMGESKTFREGDYKSTQHVGTMFREASSVKKLDDC